MKVRRAVLPYSGLEIDNWESPGHGVFAVVGPNGAGKSQWLAYLAGHLKVRGAQRCGRDMRVGLVMQHPEEQLSGETVAAEVLWPFPPGVRGQRAFQERVAAVRARWELHDALWELSPWALSTGQQRRLVFAVYDLLAPDMLLLDEPSEGLDAGWKAHLRQWLVDTAAERCILVATHDWAWALSFIPQGYWCEGQLARVPEDLGTLWYRHRPLSEDPLENLWRMLRDCGAPVDLRGWIEPAKAAEQVVRLCNRPGH